MTSLAYDHAQRYNDMNGYADQVLTAFEANFPSKFRGYDRQAHALLASALAMQLRESLSRSGFALNYASGASTNTVGGILADVVGPAYAACDTTHGVDAATAVAAASEYTAIGFPLNEALYAEVARVAGSELCVSFVDPKSVEGSMEKDAMIADQVALHAKLVAIIEAEQTVLGPNANRNFAFVAFAEQTKTLVEAAGTALNYLFLQPTAWNDAASRRDMISALIGSQFANFVGSFGVCHQAAMAFAGGFAAVMLRVSTEMARELETWRAQYAEEVAAAAVAEAARVAAEAEAARIAEQTAAARKAAVDNEFAHLSTVFGPRFFFAPADRPGQQFHRFSVSFDEATNSITVAVQIPGGEWTWPKDQNPPANATIGGEPWSAFASRIAAASPDGYAVVVRPQFVTY